MRQFKCFLLAMLVCGAAHGVSAPQVTDRDTLKAFVQEAKVYLEKDYQGALGDFRNSKMWRSGPIYLFTANKDGFNTFHAANPSLEGKNLWDLTDINGVKTMQELISAATSGGGFVEYMWDNPAVEGDEETGSPKVSYAMMFTKPDGTQELVGSGIYPSDM